MRRSGQHPSTRAPSPSRGGSGPGSRSLGEGWWGWGNLIRLLPAFLLLSGCESVNATLVRQMHKEWGTSRRINDQIREGLDRRKEVPGPVQKTPAPPFMDQG